jgi:hypothetical protein
MRIILLMWAERDEDMHEHEEINLEVWSQGIPRLDFIYARELQYCRGMASATLMGLF